MCFSQNQPSVTLKPLCAYVLLSKPTICHFQVFMCLCASVKTNLLSHYKALMCLCLEGAEGVEELEDEACLVAAALHVAHEFGYVCTVVEIQP